MSNFLKNLLGIRDDDDDDEEVDHEPDRGYHATGRNTHPAHIYDELTGLTKHERIVFEQYLRSGLRDGAAELGMNKGTFHKIVNNAKDKLDVRGDQNELYKWYKREYTTPEDHSGDSNGLDPELYDSDGDFIDY